MFQCDKEKAAEQMRYHTSIRKPRRKLGTMLTQSIRKPRRKLGTMLTQSIRKPRRKLGIMLIRKQRKPQRKLGIMLIRKQIRENYPEPKKASEKKKYKRDPEANKAKQRSTYKLHCKRFRFDRRRAYYASASHKKASKLVRRATQCLTQKARVQHARYSLKEPKRDVQELYVKNMKQSIARDRGLVRKLTRAFASCQKELADKLKPRTLPNAVASIAACRVLNVVLKGAGRVLASFSSV